MIETVYIEAEIKDHPKTREILARFPDARRIAIERYGEVFNRKSQNFRLQKIKPALILAKKYGKFVLEVPESYGIGASRNYYFSHMLNCLYDCRYCFLQGMYESAHYVLFVNYEDFKQAMDETIAASPEPVHFFSGYDCDSLALESVTGFAAEFLEFFASRPQALIELRTKSIQIKPLLSRQAMDNCVTAFTLTPREVAEAVEHSAPSLEQRLRAMEQLQECGWKLGLRFDPVIYSEDFQRQYEELFGEVFRRIRIEQIHSVTLGPFRLPKDIFERMYKLYPDEKLLAGPLKDEKGMVTYPQAIQERLSERVREGLLRHIPENLLFEAKTPV